MVFRAWMRGWVCTTVMEMARYIVSKRAGFEATDSNGMGKVGPWGIYGEAIGNPKFYVGTNPKDSEFLQADAEFAAAHEDYLRELAKY